MTTTTDRPGTAVSATELALIRQHRSGGLPRTAGDQEQQLDDRGLRVLRARSSTCSRSASAWASSSGTVTDASGNQIPYAAFIAPALLAVSAMNGAVYDSTWNVFFKMHFGKLYEAMLYTSLGPLDVALGEITLALIRGGTYAVGFMMRDAGARAQSGLDGDPLALPRRPVDRVRGSPASAWASPAI